MKPELEAVKANLEQALRLLAAHEARDHHREPVPLKLEDLPTLEECEARGDDGRWYGRRCVAVHRSAGPMLVYAYRWRETNGVWRAVGRYGFPSSGTIYGASEDEVLYPLEDWPELVRIWLAGGAS